MQLKRTTLPLNLNNRILSCLLLLGALALTHVEADAAPAESNRYVYEGSPKFAYGFSSHMVLQRDTEFNVWGFASPGESVTVSIDNQQVSGQADESGEWLIKLAPMEAGGPFDLKLKSGNTVVSLEDVLIGDVWICAGQSNMRYNLASRFRDMKDENGEYVAVEDREKAPLIFADELADLREQKRFPIRHAMGGNADFDWIEVNYENASDPKKYRQGVTAVGYFFAKHLRKDLGEVPIGIIQIGNGGAAIREMLPKHILWADPGMLKMMQGYWPETVEKRGQEELDAYYEKVESWLKRDNITGPSPAEYMGRIPGHLFYHHFAPLQNLKFKGMLYYQGEADAGRGYFYRHLQRTLIDVLREHFAFSDMPFLTVLLPASKRLDYSDICESQMYLADTVKGVHAVYAPEGAWDHPKDLHPPHKEIVGQRAAMTALNEVYASDTPYLGPRYESHEIAGDTIVVTFRDTNGGLILKEGENELTGFQIAGNDKEFLEAEAKLANDADKVIVSIPTALQGGDQELQVRYNFVRYYVPVLYSKNGLPAVFFRTDDFETRTSKRAPDEWKQNEE